MPRNASGVYTLPPTNPVVPFTTIATSWANPTMSDIATALTDSLDRNGRGGMLAPFKIFDGTISAPGLGFLNEPNLGICRTSAGLMSFVSGGQTLLQVNPSGVFSLSKLLTYGEQQYRQAGQKWWRALDNAGDLTFTPSATADAEDWDVTKEFKFKSDGTVVFPPSVLAYLPLTGGTLTGDLNFSGNGRRITGEFSTSTLADRLMVQTNVLNAATNFGVIPNGTQVNARVQIFGASNPDSSNYLNIAQQNTDSKIRAQTSGAAVQGTLALGIGTTDYLSIGTNGSTTFNNDINLNRSAAGVPNPATGGLSFGNGIAYLSWDGTNFVLNGGGLYCSGLVNTPTISYTRAQPVPVVTTINGTYAADWNLGLAQNLTLGSATVVTPSNIPTGGILRLCFADTNLGLTISGVQWPSGVVPNFTTGPLKCAIVVITNLGGGLLATWSVF